MRLADINVKKAKLGDKVYKLFDSGEFYLYVESASGKLRRFKFGGM